MRGKDLPNSRSTDRQSFNWPFVFASLSCAAFLASMVWIAARVFG